MLASFANLPQASESTKTMNRFSGFLERSQTNSVRSIRYNVNSPLKLQAQSTDLEPVMDHPKSPRKINSPRNNKTPISNSPKN